MKIVFSPGNYAEKARRLFGKLRLSRSAVRSSRPLSKTAAFTDSMQVSWYPQDPLVGPPELTSFPSNRVEATRDPHPGVASPRFRVLDPGSVPADPGKIYRPGDPRFDQLMVMAVGQKILNLYEQTLGREIPWGFGHPELWIYVHRQEEPNSGYTRGNPADPDPDNRHGRVELDYFPDMLRGKTIQASESADIDAHEIVHAITDGIRDLYLESFNPDSQAFHEGNADIGAMMLALTHPSVVDQALRETGGNLRQPNRIARLGEEFGQGISDMLFIGPNQNFIRSALNDPAVFRVSDWRRLPFLDPQDGLGSEPHSYSRIWSGVWYDALVNVYEVLRSRQKLEPKPALLQAARVMSDVAIRSLEFAPVGDMHFDEMGLAYLKAVKTDFGSRGMGEAYREEIKKALLRRGILTREQMDRWEKLEGSIPPLPLEAEIKDKEGAQAWLKAHSDDLVKVDPSLKPYLDRLEFKGIHRNRIGETFLQFSYRQTVTLSESDFQDPDLAPYTDQFKGTSFDLWGGLTLGFNSKKTLFAFTHDDTPSREVDDAKDYILLLIRQGLIKGDKALQSLRSVRVNQANRVNRAKTMTTKTPVPELPHYKQIRLRGVVVNENGKRTIRRVQTLMCR